VINLIICSGLQNSGEFNAGELEGRLKMILYRLKSLKKECNHNFEKLNKKIDAMGN
jgi:hypothetical protein